MISEHCIPMIALCSQLSMCYEALPTLSLADVIIGNNNSLGNGSLRHEKTLSKLSFESYQSLEDESVA